MMIYEDDPSSGSEGEDECFSSDVAEILLEVSENNESESRLVQSEAPSYEVITKESLLAAQKEDLQRVMDLLSVSEHKARTLLIHYRWDLEKLIEVYVEKGESFKFSEARVFLVELVHLDLPEHLSTVMCNVCTDDVPTIDVTTMHCGHYFCNNCWTKHFTVKINEPQSKRIRCMAYKCNAICDAAIVGNLLSVKHPDLAGNFDLFLPESYVEHNKMVKWCPSIPHCGNAIRVENNEFCEVECSCGLQFCFSCSSEAHSPCSCYMWKLWKKELQEKELWKKECRDKYNSVKWIAEHTKSCPTCGIPIEKDGGCNLISCICGQAFCWLCGEPTGRDHPDNHSCGCYKEDSEKKAVCAEQDLYEDMHYHKLYKAHTDSLKLECLLTERIKNEVSDLKARFGDFSWAINGVCTLLRSRRFLSNSYPFAYYIFGDDFFKDEMTQEERETKQSLFELRQQQLESIVANLSQFLNEPFRWYSEEEVTQLSNKVISLSGITDRFCKNMYEGIEKELLGSLQHTMPVERH